MSFSGEPGDEPPDREIFYGVTGLKASAAQYRRTCNQIRPLSSLRYRPPVPETITPARSSPAPATLSQRLVAAMDPGHDDEPGCAAVRDLLSSLEADSWASPFGLSRRLRLLHPVAYPWLGKDVLRIVRAITQLAAQPLHVGADAPPVAGAVHAPYPVQ